RLIDIVDPTPKAVDSLMRLELPADVNIEIKLSGFRHDNTSPDDRAAREGPARNGTRYDPGVGRGWKAAPHHRDRGRHQRRDPDPPGRQGGLQRRPARLRAD